MMKCDGQLNQSLKMTSEVAVAWSIAPHVFEDLMSVEEVAGVEESKAALHATVAHYFWSIEA
jgi:hypothetical protein